MDDFFQPWHLLVLLFVFCFSLVPVIFYLVTLQNALRKCAPGARTMEPGLVWLSLIPLFNLVWVFFVVLALGKSLGNEFRRRGIPCPDPYPGQSIGMAMAICKCCCIIPIVNLLAMIGAFVLWIVYWVKISGFSEVLDGPPVVAGM
ncbi:MAG TPA: hypothetical protein VGJ21_05690 [Terracidiphilus sp.]|jgi:hypothetical protein